MTDKISRVCDYCGRGDTLNWHADSNGMILVQGDCILLLMVDFDRPKLARPSFDLMGKHYHPDCLVKALTEWIELQR